MVQKSKLEIPKCSKHPEMTSGGICWKIVKPDLENIQTEKKYCNWKENSDYIRTFEVVGFISPSKDDMMIPKKCAKCDTEALLLIGESKCLNCRYIY